MAGQEGFGLSEDALRTVTDRLVRALRPRRIYLFGSHAYGSPSETSDVDLLIVVDDAAQMSVEDMKRAYGCVRGTFVPFELHFRSLDRFERRATVQTSLEYDVNTHGRLLYAA